MLLWISFAFLAAAVATLLMRTPEGANTALDANPDLEVYRDQIQELEHDAERGVIDAQQAAAARTEVARRLLKQSASDAASLKRVNPSNAKHSPAAKTKAAADRILMIAAASVPVISLALYLGLGSPSLPGRPLAARLAEPADRAAPDDMIAKVEARLREKPGDGQGWAVIAPVYLSQGRAPEAAQAFARAINLVGETPARLTGLAKANVIANNGIVNDAALKAFRRLVDLDPANVEAKYWLGVYEEQNGRPDAAASIYLDLLKAGPPDAPWRKAVEERLAAVTAKSGNPAPSASSASPASPSGITPPVLAPAGAANTGQTKGPTPAEFVAAAQKLAPEMRNEMIGRMVAKATTALKENPKDVSAWSRVVTGQSALGKSAEAATALKDARQALAGDAPALAELDALGKSLGLNS